MHVRAQTHKYTRVHAQVCMCMLACLFRSSSVYARRGMCTCVGVCTRACAWVRMCMEAHVRKYVRVHMRVHRQRMGQCTRKTAGFCGLSLVPCSTCLGASVQQCNSVATPHGQATSVGRQETQHCVCRSLRRIIQKYEVGVSSYTSMH